MTDWSFVTPRLAVGAGPTRPEDLLAAAEAGISHLLDLREQERFPQELWASRPASLRWAWNPAFDDGEAKPTEWFHRSLVFAWRALAQPRQKLLVCCVSGLDRSPATGYAILRALGHSEYQAQTLIVRARPQAAPLELLGADAAVNELGFA